MSVGCRARRGVFLVVLAILGLAAPARGDAESPDERARIEATLGKIRLPRGFSISLYALARGARTLAVGREGKAIFVGVDGGRPHVIVPGGDRAATTQEFAPAMGFSLPHGVCLSKEGALFLVERNRVTRFDDAENKWRDVAAIARVVVKAGDLVPRSEEGGGHNLRVCAVGPDDKLYIALGQPHNVAPPEKLDLYARTGVGGIVRMNLDGTGREVFATGVRNSVGMDFDSRGRLWFTDNQVDGMGDDAPPGEINRADRPGLHFGFPWYGGGHVRTREYAGDKPPEGVVFPQVEQDAHAADLGMIFYKGTMFPPEYRGGVFSAQHGSWDRSAPIGARVMFTRLGTGGEGGVSTTFAEGWNTGAGGYLGRPAGLAELPDGSLLVTDDQNGAIYRIAYRAP